MFERGQYTSPSLKAVIQLILSEFFKNMFNLPSPDDSPLAIPTFVTADDLYIFLACIEDHENCIARSKLTHSGQTSILPNVIRKLTFVQKVVLQELADRFDCEEMGAAVSQSLAATYDSLSGIKLLRIANDIDSITVARAAIIKMGAEREWRTKSSYHTWWERVAGIRPSWQMELTRLTWEFQNELVNRREERRRYSNGRRYPRSRETIMIQTTKSPEEIAAAFNPPKVSTVVMRFY